MNQEQLEALLAQIAPNGQPERLEFSESTETVEVEVPGPFAGADPVKTKRPVKVLTWIDRGTGQVLRVQADPTTGTYTKIAQGVDPKAQGEPAVTPAQVAKDEQGVEISSRQVTDDQGLTTKITTYQRADGTTYERRDTVQAAPKPPEPPKYITGPDGKTYQLPTTPGGKATVVAGLPDKVEAPKTQVVERNGQTYVVSIDAAGNMVTKDSANNVLPGGLPATSQPKWTEVRLDPDTGVWWGLDKEKGWVKMPEGEGPGAAARPTGQPGPARPNLVIGSTTKALTDYGNQLDAEVAAGRLSAGQAGARWKEAVALAPILINEAKLTQDNEIGHLNASVNLATNRMSNLTSGFNAALDTINAGNSKLPAGSTLGGKAFAAMLGLQLEHARRGGAYDVRWPGGQPPAGQPPAQAGPVGPTPPNAIGVGAIGAVPAPGGPSMPLPPPQPAASQATDLGPEGLPVPRVKTPSGMPGSLSAPGVPPEAPPVAELPAALAAYQQPVGPPPPTPRFTMGAPVGPAAPVPGAGFTGSQGPGLPSPENPAPPYALLAAQAQSTVPWRIDEETYNQWRAAGVPDDVIFSVPRFG